MSARGGSWKSLACPVIQPMISITRCCRKDIHCADTCCIESCALADISYDPHDRLPLGTESVVCQISNQLAARLRRRFCSCGTLTPGQSCASGRADEIPRCKEDSVVEWRQTPRLLPLRLPPHAY